MDTIRRVAKNTVSLLTAQILISVLSLVLSIYVARSLGDVDFGKYSFTFAFVSIFALFADFGYSTLLLREISRNKNNAKEYLNNTLSIRVIICTIVFIAIIISINCMKYSQDTKNSVYIFSIATLLTLISDIFRIVFRAFEKMEYEAITRIVFISLKVSLALFVLLLGYGLIELMIVYLLASIVDLILSYRLCHNKFIKTEFLFSSKFLKSTFKLAIPLGSLVFFDMIYIRIDTIMLSMMQGDAPVGWYNAAYNLILGLKPIPILVVNVLFPLMSTYYLTSKSSLKLLFQKSLYFLFSLGLPMATGITLLSNQFISVFYTYQFLPSVVVLQILAWDALLIFVISPLNMTLVSINREKEMNVILAVTALINIILNSIMIPLYSYIGAAVATIISEVLLVGLYLYVISKHFPLPIFDKPFLYPIISSISMGIFIYHFNELNLSLCIFISIIIYFTTYILIGGVSKEDATLLKQIIKRE